MSPRPSARSAVVAALRALCAEGMRPGLFVVYHSARVVAERAGVSEGTARRHLESCVGCRGYRATRIRGVRAYRWDADLA